jgi:Fe-S-cluster-containing hydrogenase component 2
VGDINVPLQCRHCEDALCLEVCPTEAIHRVSDSGPVVLETKLCSSCRLCLLVCPDGVIDTVQRGRTAIKCDLCQERAEEGLEPVCVTSCPTGALTFEDVSEYERDEQDRGKQEGAPRAAPQTIKLTHDEYLAHAFNRTLPLGLLDAVTSFIIDAERCNGCGRCLKYCPIDGITGEKKSTHFINQELCLRCGQCRDKCPIDIVETDWDSSVELVLCDDCGRPYTTLRDFEQAQCRIGERAVIEAVCPECRRKEVAGRLAAVTEQCRPMGCTSSDDS